MDLGRRHLNPRYAVLLLGALAGVVSAGRAQASCMSLKSGPVVYDVTGCGQVEPERHFDTTKDKYSWIAGLDAAGRKKFFDSYRGLYLKGKVVKSEAVEKGLTGDTGQLSGQDVLMFVPPGQQTCAGVNGKRVSGQLQEICCDGGGDPPCLLNTSYVLKSPQALGAAASGAGDALRVKASRSKDYKLGDAAFAAKNYKEATKYFERARTNDELDIKGHYKLGFAYRELDQCRDAERILKHVNEQRERKTIWADEESVARQAAFLLARCYSKMNEPGAAVLLLNSYLLEPQKYKKELRESLSHKDFGWIHTSREYRDYKKEAQKKLGR